MARKNVEAGIIDYFTSAPIEARTALFNVVKGLMKPARAKPLRKPKPIRTEVKDEQQIATEDTERHALKREAAV